MTLLLLLALAVPNATATPGKVHQIIDAKTGKARPRTVAEICGMKWGLDHRNVTEKMKRDVATAYGLQRTAIKARGKGPCCEIDHLLPRELGGDDDVLNLWPQNWLDAHQKDVEENRLHRAVCAPHPTITLEAAQDEMRHWGRR